MNVLDQHFGSGRIDVDEYGERSAQIAAARTRKDLRPLFADLPDPKPAVLRQQRSSPGAPPVRASRTVPQILATSAVPIAAIVAVVLFLTVLKFWFVLLIPVLVAACLGRWGSHPRRGHGRGW